MLALILLGLTGHAERPGQLASVSVTAEVIPVKSMHVEVQDIGDGQARVLVSIDGAEPVPWRVDRRGYVSREPAAELLAGGP